MIGFEEFGSGSRRMVLTIALGVAFTILFFRLVQLQVYYHEELGRKSEENRVRTIVREPVRGYMYDRTGRLVVDVGPSFSVFVTPAEFDTSMTGLLASLVQVDPAVIQERLRKGRRYSAFSPTRVVRDVPFTVLSAVEERVFQLPGVSYDVESKRVYHEHVNASHLLGYCKEITDAQLAKAGPLYSQGDIIGSTGIEFAYERFLRGSKGYQYISVNSKGQVIGPLEDGTRDLLPQEGYDLLLEADFGLQAFAESLMTDKQGAIVALDVNSGGVLALVSRPDFDPADFSGVTPADIWLSLNTDASKPLFNRATMTRYPPGSTFKMLVALAALQEGIIDENYTITCTGGFRFGNRVFKDLHVHGKTDIVKSIQQSCNVFYYSLVLKLGLPKLTEYAQRFGFGRPTGFDVGEETAGLVPSEAYYDRVYGKGKWTQGNVVNLGIGQGEIGVSPIQMARYVAAIANGGVLHQPHAVQAIRDKRLNLLSEIESSHISTGVQPAAFALIREGMQKAVMEPGGTAGLARIPGLSAAGKTGTAQNAHGEDHAWFVGYAPADTPKVAVAVLVENAGFGGTIAAPIAGYVMERYLKGRVDRPVWLPKPKAQRDTARTMTVNQPR
ncbi:MAG: penicillin-binding protein 2 [Bacteroidetes bacterium]|jgi:penicillin-binding protein 2|nr:penicillin-binding protein 2 [Bacteroidota bacterium]